jgi:hypothetical protein
MFSCRSLRRFVASIVVMLFLACQAAGTVHARSAEVPQPDGVAAQGSCHDLGQRPDTSSGKSDCQVNCESQLTPSSPSSPMVLAATDLPAILIHARSIVAISERASSFEPPLLRAEPPPLAILYCCLRN